MFFIDKKFNIPEPAIPTVQAPAPINLAAESISLETADVWKLLAGNCKRSTCEYQITLISLTIVSSILTKEEDIWLVVDWLGAFKKLAVYMLGILAEAILLLVWLKALQLLETAALCEYKYQIIDQLINTTLGCHKCKLMRNKILNLINLTNVFESLTSSHVFGLRLSKTSQCLNYEYEFNEILTRTEERIKGVTDLTKEYIFINIFLIKLFKIVGNHYNLTN